MDLQDRNKSGIERQGRVQLLNRPQRPGMTTYGKTARGASSPIRRSVSVSCIDTRPEVNYSPATVDYVVVFAQKT